MKVKFLGWIASLAGKREMEVSLERPAQLRELLPFSLQGRDNIIILVNNNPGSEEVTVENQDHVVLMPVISGG
ncbi:MAG: MoaD/ThiS family protein [Theionarchaea archaeon]|nr:MoaD/ThiS family protein [Theionarchaea archaeon]